MGTLVKVVDSTFSHNPSIGYAGERRGEYPQAFQWDTTPGDASVKVWTDIRLKEALQDTAERKIALLVESPLINVGGQEWILNHADQFAAVLTHQRWLVERGAPFLFYPLGGSWIRHWGMFAKNRPISIILSEKEMTEAHRLRHSVAKLLPPEDCYGTGVGKSFDCKVQALRPYYFSVVIENCGGPEHDWYFSEKLIDCLSQGAIPIYYGCDVSRFFNMQGIIQWRDLEELSAILDCLTPEDYDWRREAVQENLVLARQFQCPEDAIAKRYPDLFG